jgi:predicted transglutaminase-like cysteine proteinase
LLRRGFPSAVTRLAEVKTIEEEGHLVLVVATTKGDVMLDNLTNEVRPWTETNYRWLKSQSKDAPRFWLELKSPIIVPAAIREVFRKIYVGLKR